MSTDIGNYINNFFASTLFLVQYSITVVNSSGVAITVKYGSVYEWWLSSPNKIAGKDLIQVDYNILSN